MAQHYNGKFMLRPHMGRVKQKVLRAAVKDYHARTLGHTRLIAIMNKTVSICFY